MGRMKSRLSPPVFKGRLHDARTATSIGRWLGSAFAVCFVTGLVSHFMQHPPDWLANHIPSRPSWGYRLTQGLHVASGIAAIPLLLAKLWAVYPRLFERPPLRSVKHALERLSIAVLVAGAVFELATGLLNTAQWYPWPFSFVPVHYAVAWLVVGALVLHLAVKAPEIRAHWSRMVARDARPARTGRTRPAVPAGRGGRCCRGRHTDHRGPVLHPAEGLHPVRTAPPGPGPTGPARQPDGCRGRMSDGSPTRSTAWWWTVRSGTP